MTVTQTYRGRQLPQNEQDALTKAHEAGRWKDRDKLIVTAWNAGTSLRCIADHLGMSAGTIHWIVKQHPSYAASRYAAGKVTKHPTRRSPWDPPTRRRRKRR